VNFFLPLRVGVSPAYRRVRRVVAPAGESLSFVASNESNQSKDALHFAVPLRLLPSATCLPSLPSDHGTPVQSTPPLGSLRIAITHEAKRGVDGEVCEANDRIALGPRGGRRGAQGFGAARVSALRQLTSRGCLSAAATGREASSARGPKDRAPQSSPARAGPPPSGRLSFGSFSLAKQRKGTALSGAYPDAASRSEHGHDKAGLRYLSLSGWRFAGGPCPELRRRISVSGLRFAKTERRWRCAKAVKARDLRTAASDRPSPNGKEGANK